MFASHARKVEGFKQAQRKIQLPRDIRKCILKRKDVSIDGNDVSDEQKDISMQRQNIFPERA